jgi:hypothetical protein
MYWKLTTTPAVARVPSDVHDGGPIETIQDLEPKSPAQCFLPNLTTACSIGSSLDTEKRFPLLIPSFKFDFWRDGDDWKVAATGLLRLGVCDRTTEPGRPLSLVVQR